MDMELDVDSKIALSQIGFKPICSLGPGSIGERWLFNNSTLGAVCGELVDPNNMAARAALDDYFYSTSTIFHDGVVKMLKSGQLTSNVYGAIFDIFPADPRLISSAHTLRDTQSFEKFLHQMTSTISYLHKCGVVHGAISPHAIVQQADRVRIGDFWWSHDTSECQSGSEDNLPRLVPNFAQAFAAPEVRAGELTSRESDIYSLGAVVYWVASGMLPATLHHSSSQQSAETRHQVPSLRFHRPDLDMRLVQLVDLMLSFEPSERPIAPWVNGMVEELAERVSA